LGRGELRESIGHPHSLAHLQVEGNPCWTRSGHDTASADEEAKGLRYLRYRARPGGLGDDDEGQGDGDGDVFSVA
jgi:hypothetical protein